MTNAALTDYHRRRIASEEILPLISEELITEHRESPFDGYSDDLHRVLWFLRRTTDLEYFIVATDPHVEWTLAKRDANGSIELLDERYDSQAEAEHAIFRKRINAFRERFGADYSKEGNR
ncbi:hypothetical protein EA473_12445 [Natrarchaeobius chitinivorans]|uniref:N,N-dimethylformamidase alpha subunit domain-containing protein n=2 Tax=Natrarchaeobius chitinivorans TaxID=1679083 RepID=A0A3N6MCC6_NATCH|nr:hypothetical protein EA473_12445 [Natrarchaeobius chitinivorans]